MKNLDRIGLHCIFWMVYLLLNAVLNCAIHNWPMDKLFWKVLQGEAMSLPIKMALTYYVFYYIIPLYMDRSRLWKMILMLLEEIK